MVVSHHVVRDADYKTLESELWRYGWQNHTCHISWVNGTIGLRVVVRGALGRDEVSSYRWPPTGAIDWPENQLELPKRAPTASGTGKRPLRLRSLPCQPECHQRQGVFALKPP